MALIIVTEPSVEPVTLAEVKAHLRLDSTDFADDITSVQSIAPGAHVVAAGYSLSGSSIEVLGYSVLVLLESGTNGAGGTVDVKIQHRDAEADAWADWTGGAFTQVTTANDNATYEKSYTGNKRYIRVVATVAVATCEFGVSVLKDSAISNEDDWLTSAIITARDIAESVCGRAFITQTWDLWIDCFPEADFFWIPLGPLQSVSSIKYYDISNVEATFANTFYFVDTKSYKGRIHLNYSQSWPSTTLRPANGVAVQFVAGFGATAAAIPKSIKQAMLLHIGEMYKKREFGPVENDKTYRSLLGPHMSS